MEDQVENFASPAVGPSHLSPMMGGRLAMPARRLVIAAGKATGQLLFHDTGGGGGAASAGTRWKRAGGPVLQQSGEERRPTRRHPPPSVLRR